MKVTPLSPSLRKETEIGAVVELEGADLANLSVADKDKLRQALYDNHVLVLKNQKDLNPQVIPDLCKLWDTNQLDMHGHGGKGWLDKGSILAANHSSRIPTVPQVMLIGHGKFEGKFGTDVLNLRHVNHTEFHKHVLSDEQIAAGETRFYRWHIDAPLYELQPAKVTMLYSIVNSSQPDQFITFENGERLDLAAGATAFFSGAKLFSLLTPEEQDWALRTKVQYAPRPYNFMLNCKATSDGLTLVSEGKELALSEIPAFEWDKVQTHPLVWANPGRPDRPSIQTLGCCLYRLITTNADGSETIMDDIGEVRKKIHGIQSRMMCKDLIYAHNWAKDDLVIFNNHAVTHTITGQIHDERLFWQCNLASKDAPVGQPIAA